VLLRVIALDHVGQGADTSGSRRRLAGEPHLDAESLGISPDGSSLTVSFREELLDLMLAEGVRGVKAPRSDR
jgi:hypothetical protein